MKRIYIVAFRGVSAEQTNVDALIQAGHVGFRFEQSQIIYGFHPTPGAISQAGGQQAAIAVLKERNGILAGSLQDDTDIFVGAHRLSVEIEARNARITSGPRFRSPKVWFWYFGVRDDRFNEVRQLARDWTRQAVEFPYAFPPRKPTIMNLKELTTDNCATFLRRLGLPILPFNDAQALGQMSDYMDAFEIFGERWYPKEKE